ncbi:hypothetical protein Aglo03_05120 [Actinokineospora globicatena]|uniref:Uncharacterized protein n=1 Tax=Actinokineospora globicatena TaxID=103729 RepID=A0A9W6QGK2_9PSEU|nr:hypothetical protein Aglo03_05120 [Actinokineospora globicatena]
MWSGRERCPAAALPDWGWSVAADSRLTRWPRADRISVPFRPEAWCSPWLTEVLGLVLLVVVGQGALSGRGFARLGLVRGG